MMHDFVVEFCWFKNSQNTVDKAKLIVTLTRELLAPEKGFVIFD